MDGGCYCGALRYHIEGEASFKGQCHCRECQTFSGGAANHYMGIAPDAFTYTTGQPKSFARVDLETPVTREFCADCGTQILSRPPGLPWLIVKVGTLDDPSTYEQAHSAIYTKDMQSFHHIPEGMPSFKELPPRR